MFKLGHPTGGASSSSGMATNTMGGHRGHGFALGHVNFQLPSRTAPVRRGRTGARTLTPERFLGRGNQHGNAERVDATASEIATSVQDPRLGMR